MVFYISYGSQLLNSICLYARICINGYVNYVSLTPQKKKKNYVSLEIKSRLHN